MSGRIMPLACTSSYLLNMDGARGLKNREDNQGADTGPALARTPSGKTELQGTAFPSFSFKQCLILSLHGFHHVWLKSGLIIGRTALESAHKTRPTQNLNRMANMPSVSHMLSYLKGD